MSSTTFDQSSSYYQPVRQIDTSIPESYDTYQHDTHKRGDSLTASEQLKADHFAYIGVHDEPCQWTIGWKTPLTMIVGFMLAIAVAVFHYFYCRYLDKKWIVNTIPQSWNQGVSIAFARAFSITLAASASSAFTQLLWWYLRRKPLTLAKVDAVFSLNTSPLNLYQMGLLRMLPILWFFGLLFPLISVATIFPPGALLVQQLGTNVPFDGQVPSLDLAFRGNGTAVDLFRYSMFITGNDGPYMYPDIRYASIGSRTLLGGTYLTRLPPDACGSNCTYKLVFPGPRLHCEDTIIDTEDLRSKVFVYENGTEYDPGWGSFEWEARQCQFLAASYKSNNTILGPSSDEYYVFDVSFMDQETKAPRNISCITMSSMYTADVSFVNGTQTVDAEVTEGTPMNATFIGYDYLFYSAINSQPWYEPVNFSITQSGSTAMSDEEISAAFNGSQLMAMRDTLINPLKGALTGFGGEGYLSQNTIVQNTPLASPVHTDYSEILYSRGLYFNITPAVLEDLMKNVTISILNHAVDPCICPSSPNDVSGDVNTSLFCKPHQCTAARVEDTGYEQSYVFKEPARLIVAYGVALGVCLIFIALGFVAMLHIGVSATSGGFFQVLCTTAASGAVNRLAQKACLGGEQSLPKELQELEGIFGEMRRGPGEPRLAAFGTAKETVRLVKGDRIGVA